MKNLVPQGKETKISAAKEEFRNGRPTGNSVWPVGEAVVFPLGEMIREKQLRNYKLIEKHF